VYRPAISRGGSGVGSHFQSAEPPLGSNNSGIQSMQTISEPVTRLVTGHGFYFKVLLSYNTSVVFFFTVRLQFDLCLLLIAVEMSNHRVKSRLVFLMIWRWIHNSYFF